MTTDHRYRSQPPSSEGDERAFGCAGDKSAAMSKNAPYRKMLFRFRRQSGGSAAVDFALVAPVFFALLFAILEAGITFLAGSLLQSITSQAARMVQTGQAQTGSYTASQFKTYVCQQIPALFDCLSLSVDVRSYPAFSTIDMSNPLDSNGNFQSGNLKYDPGGSGSIVVVRLFYAWPLVVTGLGWNPANMAGNKRLLVGTSAFKNEPY